MVKVLEEQETRALGAHMVRVLRVYNICPHKYVMVIYL